MSDGPLIQSLAQVRNPRLLTDADNVTRRWSGGDASNPYLTPFPLLTNTNLLLLGPNRVIWTNLDTRRSGFAGQLMSTVQASNSTYNAYTFYRLLGSVGTDSSDGRIEVGVDLANRYYRRAKLNLNDQVLDLAITANRPDGLSMRGIAREVAALAGGRTTFSDAPAVSPAQPLVPTPEAAAAIEAGGLFSVTALAGVRVAPSPAWLRQRLERAGLRAINNVVDITNLVMLETGQPLHAFDRDALARLGGGAGRRFRLRHAHSCLLLIDS
jgi:hypothetical protein